MNKQMLKPIINRMTLRRFNNLLSAVIFVLALYIFFLPVVPELAWWFKHSAPVVSTPVNRKLASVVKVPADNRLIIPSIDLNQEVYQGQSVYTVNKGVWLRPNGSTPDKGSNTIMAGHRLTYTNPRGVFYYLDKIKIGDPIEVYWQGKDYRYVTRAIVETVPQDTTVERPTPNPILTLYTCTPLWNFKHRLIIIASEVSHT